MNQTQRENLIEKIGRIATDEIEDLEQQVKELRDYLQVGRIASTKGVVLKRKDDGR